MRRNREHDYREGGHPVKMITIALTITLALITIMAHAEIYRCFEGANIIFQTKSSSGCKLIPGSASAHNQEEWYEGGNLKQATAKEWQEASYRNRLATSADWFQNITKSHNVLLHMEFYKLYTPNAFLGALRTGAVRLESCISERVSVMKDSNTKASTIGMSCYESLYGLD